MKNKILKILLLLFCICTSPCLLSSVNAAESNTQTVQVQVEYGQTEARTMFDMINEFRTGNEAWVWNSSNTGKIKYSNLKTLKYDYELEKIAMQRAAEIAVSYSHTRPNGTSCFTAYNSYKNAGENIAAGYTSAEAVFEGWKETSKKYEGQGHRRNMLNSSFTAVGIGHVYYNGCHYWVQEFRNPASSTATTAANNSLTAVNVNVLTSKTTITATASPNTLSVRSGNSVNLPTINTTVKTADTWPSSKVCKVTASITWSVKDNQYASISGNTLVGKKTGNTTLYAKVLGKTISIPVTIAVADHEHLYTGTITKKATCTSSGIKTYSCSKCKASYTEAIPATGHSYKNGYCKYCNAKNITYTTYQTTTNVNYRSGAGTGYAKKGSLKAGTKIQIENGYSKSANGYTWYRFKMNGNNYYIVSKYVKKVAVASNNSSNNSNSVTLTNYKTTTAVNYRSGAGTGYAKKGRLAKNTTVKVVNGWSKNANGYTWYKVQINGNYYYIASKYLKKMSTETNNNPSSVKTLNYKTTTAVNYRSGAGTGYAKKGRLAKNTTVKVVNGWSKNANGYTWYKVQINGNYYYIASKYLKKC